MNILSIQNDIVKAAIYYANHFKYLIQSCDIKNDAKLSIPWALVPEKKRNAVGGMACAK